MNNIKKYQLPWKIEGDYIVNSKGVVVLEWLNNIPLSRTLLQDDDGRPFAEHIVNCVNTFKTISPETVTDMVRLLLLISVYFSQDEIPSDYPGSIQGIVHDINKILPANSVDIKQ